MITFPSRKAAEDAYIASSDKVICVIHDETALTYIRGKANNCLRTNAGVVDWKPAEAATVQHWGAVGNFDGKNGADSTYAIDRALGWVFGADARSLHFSDGWYFYDGAVDINGGDARFSKVTCSGQITFGASHPVAWTIHNIECPLIQINMRNGGRLGNFNTRTPTGGGTTAIQVHNTQWADIRLVVMNYRGRALHGTCKTTKSEDRNIRANVSVTFGQRQITGDDWKCGQPIYWDNGTVSNTGGTGTFRLFGSGCYYGPIWERCNDVTLGDFEFGPCTVQGPKFRGVAPLLCPVYWVGECADHCIAGEPGPQGARNYEWHFGTMKVFKSGEAGAYLSGFFAGKPSARINSFMATKSGGPGLHMHDARGAVVIDAVGVDRATDGIKITGHSGDMKIHFDYDIGLTGSRVNDTSTGGNVVIT